MNRGLFIQLGIALSLLSVLGALTVGARVYLESVTARAVALGREVAQKESETVRAASARTTLPALEGAEQTVASRLVRTRDIVPFLEQLERQGTAQGAIVTVLSVNSAQSSGDSRVVIALTVTGTFDSVLRSIGAIEYGPYDTLLTTVTITKAEEARGGWKASVTLSVGTNGDTMIETK